MNLNDAQLAATCIADEASNQPYEGRVAVACVIHNRLTLPYSSDGTMVGTILHKWAFSGFWAAMENGKYQQVAFDLADAENRAQELFEQFSAQPTLWRSCQQAWTDAQAWAAGQPMSFTPGPAFAKITRKTVLYLNPAIVHPLPAWATPENEDAVIFSHVFYHDS